MSKYYRDHYDVIIIGASLAGLSAALTLLNKGYSVLVLEQHNLPGGVATSFVRGGVELEASLHEMLSIGSKECPLRTRTFFEENGIHINWLYVPYVYRYVSPYLDVRIRAGKNGDYTLPCQDIAKACGDKDGSIYEKLMKFFQFCLEIHTSACQVSGNRLPKTEVLFKHLNFVKTFGYTFDEVAKSFDLPDLAIEILSAYWMYLGTPSRDLPFTVYGFLLADYFGYGPYIPPHTSHEMSLKLAEAVMDKSGQVEFSQRVEKILVKDKKVCGVRLSNGETINSSYVISGAYPNTVYQKMIEPKEEVPPVAIKNTNAMELGVSCFSVVLLLDKSHEELGLNDYATFNAIKGMDSNKVFDSGKDLNKWEYLTCICTNVVDEEASPKGTCIYTMTYLPSGESFKDVSQETYEQYKNLIVNHFIEEESKRLDIDLKSHILEIVVETPVTVSHYTGAYMGAIYGYRHSMENHAAVREMNDEMYISGLAFAGSHQPGGDGMSPAINNGRIAAKEIIWEDERRKKK